MHPQCCIQLANNKLSPDQLTQDVLDLLANRPPQRPMGQLNVSEEDGARSTVSMEILKMLQQLTERAVHVQRCCFCVINCFKIAMVTYHYCNGWIFKIVFSVSVLFTFT